ncbi:unnamed protein product [Ilex paraguariensis]|uniref:Scarecrow-like protein 9 n=1 Tax=Ilex paraguariensis TaxID=185542 RepID=A0ABC8UD20_9AQUA
MDPRVRPFSGSINGAQLENQSVSVFPDEKLVSGGPRFENIIGNGRLIRGPRFENTFLDHSWGGIESIRNDPPLSNTFTSSSTSREEDYHEDCDFSDAVLSYINQVLMEEDMEDKTCMLQESLDLQAKEKSFYEVLGKKYPPSSPDPHPTYAHQTIENSDDCLSEYQLHYTSSSRDGDGYLLDPSLVDLCWKNNSADCDTSLIQSLTAYKFSHSLVSTIDGFLGSPISPLHFRDLYNESQSIWQFRKGVEEAKKFLPNGNGLLVGVDVNGLFPQELKGENGDMVNMVKKKDEGEYSSAISRGRKNPKREGIELEEGRSSKQAAVYAESTVRSKEFDLVLLCSRGKGGSAMPSYSESLRHEASKKSKGSSGGKGRGKRQNGKKEVVDLRTLLIHCAQAVAADDRMTIYELLKQIRQHSSPFGDGNQRLAHCFANGLEARMAGTGSQIHKALVSKRASAADYLKAYHLYLTSCPFRKISNFASNRTILIKAENAMRIHIIDFGILYGFQWPTFIQRMSSRNGGPPMIRITGIEFPQPGFRPAERIEETGRRLADYAQSFKVPFEYTAIANKWEHIKVEDLKIDKDEFLVVNCLYRSENLLDETVAVSSPRNIVINLIRKINPDIFIHGIVNGAYNAPFFVTRFREALFHFSALFDMLETNVPREHCQRMLIEREYFGREALNVIACEGWERVERPETYKQWHVRNLRAGFTQIPFDREIMERATNKVRSYHKDFLIDEDSQWLVQGWKGRIIYALSCWKPV